MTISRTKAIRIARDNTGLLPAGYRQWQVQHYCKRAHAWYQGHPTTYAMARTLYAEKIAEHAALLMLGNDYSDKAARHFGEYPPYTPRHREGRTIEQMVDYIVSQGVPFNPR